VDFQAWMAVRKACNDGIGMNTMTYIPPFELALIRWSVVCGRWHEMSSGSMPNLTAFLGGGGSRCVGLPIPGKMECLVDSFRVGWAEADTAIAIELQNRSAPK